MKCRSIGRVLMLILLATPTLASAQDGPRPLPPPGMDYPPPPPGPPAAPALMQVRAGDALMMEGRYREAVAQFELAYAIDHALPILERLAEAYRMAGDMQRANIAYQRVAAQRGYPQGVTLAPISLAPPAPPPPVRRPGQGLINTGITLLSVGYGIGLVGGIVGLAAVSDFGGVDRGTWYGATGMLLIPIVGPFATIGFEHDPLWAVPWAVIDGGLQLSGLALLIAGAATRSQHKALPVTIAPFSTATTRGLAVSGTF